jgi:hypothetical protein
MSAADAADRWSSIISLATLGTNRARTSPDKVWPSEGLPLPAGTTERTLLRAAAVSYLSQISGTRIASVATAAEEPAPTLEDKVVNENAAWRLARMLNGEHRNLVPEWFALAARGRWVLPPHWLPAVLDRLQVHERASASPVLGRRALWLARRNPEWKVSGVAHEPSEERWVNGTLAERRLELAGMRAIDPAKARTWLEGTWQTDPPDARAAFLETILHAPGLSASDEPFLESALDDKRKDVRAAAVECLCRLPGSAHARRNLERLYSLVTLEARGGGLLGKLKRRRLTIQLPDALDKESVRDGVSAKPPAQQKIGERAYWLMQRVSMAPPAHWCERFDCDIQTFLDAAAATDDYPTDLFLALCEAARRHQDAPWIAALCNRTLSWPDDIESQDIARRVLTNTIAGAPSASRDAILGQLLGAAQSYQLDLVQPALLADEAGWSADTTQRAFKLLEELAMEGSNSSSRVPFTFADWGPRAESFRN